MESIFNDCDCCSLTAICSLYKANNTGLSGKIASICHCKYCQIKSNNVSPPPLLDPAPRIRDVGAIIAASEKIARLQENEEKKQKMLQCCKCEKLIKEEDAIIDAMTSYVFCEDCY